MRKIMLAPAEFVVADNLTYDQAYRAMKSANEHSVGKKYTFYLTAGIDRSASWTLMARDTSWNADFIKNPKDYIIEINE